MNLAFSRPMKLTLIMFSLLSQRYKFLIFLKAFYCADPFYRNIKTVMTIHNLKFQGITEIDRLKDITGLPDDMFTYDKLEYNNSANLLKGGLVFSTEAAWCTKKASVTRGKENNNREWEIETGDAKLEE